MAATAPVFAAMGVREIRAGLASKDFSAREIAESSLARVRALDGATHAFLETTEQLALQQAAALTPPSRPVRWTRAARWPACPWRSKTT